MQHPKLIVSNQMKEFISIHSILYECSCFFATSLINLKYRSTNVRFYLSHDIKLLKNRIFGVKTLKFCHSLHNIIMDDITL